MASIIKVDTIQDQDGNNIISEAANTITIGASGDTITIPSGATLANSGIVTGFQSTGIDDNATSTAITIDSSERVGIGTSSPDENLHIQTSTNTPGTIKLERGTSNVGTGEAVGELKFATADISYTGYTSTDEVAKISAVSPNSFGDRYDLAFYTGISTESTPGERLRITNNGRVGINTSSPSQDLSISNSGNTALELLSGTSSTGQLLFSDSGYGGIGNIQYSHSDNSMRFGINTSERMRIDSSGNVGIGTSSPLRALSVVGASNAYANFDDISHESFTIGSDANGFLIYSEDAAAYRFNIDSSGNVGIGTSSPESALDVGSGTITQREGNVRNTISSSGTGFEFIANATSQNVTRNFVFKSSTSGGGVTERMRITSTGRVGIGTSSPAQALTIGGITSTPGDYKGLAFQSGSSEVSYVRSNCVNGNNYFLTFGTYASGLAERMRIDSSGNVGISTTSTSSANLVIATNSNSGSGIRLIGKSANGGAEIDYYNNANNTLNGFLEISDTQGTLSAVTNIPFTFRTNNTERMRIDTSGNVGINTTSPESGSLQTISHPGSSKYGLNLDSSNTSGTQYHLQFKRGGTQAGYITSNSATTIAVNNASDERLKENIQNSGSAIQDIKDMQVRQFDWIDGIDTHRDFGFVAQELVNVVPEAVTQGTDELDDNGKPVRSWGVDYSHIVPRLVKVCQEQQTKIEELEARITALETQP
jgi:hypothetical protein